MSGLPSGLTPIGSGGALPQGLTPIAKQQPSALPQGLTPLSQPSQPAAQPNQDPAGFRKYLTSGGIYSQNPSVNVMQDFATNYGGVPMKGGITPAFRSIVTQLTNQGNKLGVYDFNAGHTSLGAASPHAQGRAADFDTINGEPVGTHLSPNLGTFINQALQTDPRVRVGVPKEIFNQLGGLTGNGRIFVDDPAHIHIELDPMAAAPGKAPAVQQFKPDQPKPGKPIEAGIGDALKNAAGAIEETGKGFFKGMYYEQSHPLEAYSDLEGVFQRAVTGYLSKTGTDKFPVPTGPAIGQAIYDAFHPHSAEVQQRDTDTAIRGLFEPFGGKESSNVWAHFGQAIAAQSATDPLTYLMPMLRGGAAISDMAKIADGAEGVPEIGDIISNKSGLLQKLGNTAAGKFVDHYFGIRPELNEYLDQHAKDARMIIEHSANAHIEPMRFNDEQMLAQHEGELRNVTDGELPDAVRQRYLAEPYQYGDAEMRQQALQMGYRPTPEEAAKPPQGLLKYNLKDDYQTLISPPKGETQEQAFQRISGGEPSRENAGFEKESKAEGDMGGDHYDITENRLRLGRNLIRRRMIDQQTQGYMDKYGGWKNDAPVKSVEALSDKAWSIKTPVGEWFNKLSKESIKAFPFPHAIGNVGQLAWNKGGWTAVGKAMYYAVRGLKPEQQERLKSMGLWAEYLGKDMSSPWRKPPLSYLAGKGVDKAIDYSTQILNRLEGGFRQGLLDLADHQHGVDPGNLQNEYNKAKDVLDAMGDYANVSKVVATLQGVMGAPFVAFGLSIVPKALLKAIKEHPERLAGNARMIQDLQADHGGPLPAGSRLGGGPNEAFARLATDPVGYLESPSRIGPAGVPLQVEERIRHGEAVDPGQEAAQAAQRYGGILTNTIIGGLGLAHPAPGEKAGISQANLRNALLGWMTGRYMEKEPSEKGQEYFNRLEETGTYPKRIHRHHFSQ